MIETERCQTIYLSGQVYSFLNLFQKCCFCLTILAAFSTPASISAVSDCQTCSSDSPCDVPICDFEYVYSSLVHDFTFHFSSAPPSISLYFPIFISSYLSPFSSRLIF